jgi:uncharacterized membrane protein YfcA
MITLLLAASAFLAGIVNAIAGGGSFLTFPALIFSGIPPIAANASSAAALLPASLTSVWAYRRDFEPVEGLSALVITLVSIAGGAIGALLLLLTPETTFVSLVPWLLLAATTVFAFGRQTAAWARSHFRVGPAAVLVIQFLISIYGGYFGGGIGILMLAAFGIFGMTRLNAMNALKAWLNFCLNAIAVALFIVKGEVFWREAAIMAAAASAGGYAGATLARVLPARVVRVAIIAIGLVLTAYFFTK